MKNKILSRVFATLMIVAFSAMITAGACSIKVQTNIKNDDGKYLKVEGHDAKGVKVENGVGTETTVSIVHGSGKGYPADDTTFANEVTMDFASTVVKFLDDNAYKAVKKVFTVSIKDTKQGIVLSRVPEKESLLSLYKTEEVAMGVIRAAGADDTTDDTGKLTKGLVYLGGNTSATSTSGKTLSFITALLGSTDGFSPIAEEEVNANLVGLFCVANASKFNAEVKESAELVATNELKDAADQSPQTEAVKKINDKTFEDAHESKCYTTRDIKTATPEWAKANMPVVKKTLVFVGINTGSATVKDIAELAPTIFSGKDGAVADGFNADNLKKLAKAYPTTSVQQVVVKIVDKI